MGRLDRALEPFARSGRRGRVRVRVSAVAAALALVLLATACQLTHSPASPASSGAPRNHGPSVAPTLSSPAPTPTSSAEIRISPADGSVDAHPDAGISVTAAGGTITRVAVSTTSEHPVVGTFDSNRTAWHSLWALGTSASYTVRATAVDPGGNVVADTASFRTFTPTQTFRTVIFQGFRQAYGVGMPIILEFDRPITDKAAIERSLQLWTSKPVVGAWYWDGDQTLYFRPRVYWPQHTTVRFVGHLDGVEGAPGVYGVHTLTQTFLIGRSLIAVASTRTHHVQIYLDKKLFGDWPISSGRPGDDTPDGTYLTINKANPVDMKGPGYNIEVPWSVRFTWSGDYMHDAFWSVNQQGFTNVSHGCVNLSPAHAETYYKLAVQGDPVTVTGSPRPGKWDNGWTVWFLNWRQVVRGSALHSAVAVGPEGSKLVNPFKLPPPAPKPPLGAPQPGNALA